MDHNLDKWENFRINAKFSLPNGTVKEGDTTTITLPDKLAFGGVKNFEIKDKDGHTVANASIDSSTKKLTLTYTDYPETHSDVSGNFYFYAYVNHRVVTQKGIVPVTIDVEGKVLDGGTVNFNGVGDAKVT